MTTAEPCAAEHPEIPGLLCDKPRPCYIYHWNDTAKQDWPGPPIPDKGSRKKEVDKMAGDIPRPRTTGPPVVGCPDCRAKDQEIARLRSYLSARERKQLLDTDAHAKSQDPWTSHHAAEMLSGPKRWDHRLLVLMAEMVACEGEGDGATDDEMLEILGPDAGAAYSTFRTCRKELLNLNLVFDSGVTRPSKATKRPCIVWAVAPGVLGRFQAMRAESDGIRATRPDLIRSG